MRTKLFKRIVIYTVQEHLLKRFTLLLLLKSPISIECHMRNADVDSLVSYVLAGVEIQQLLAAPL